MMIFFQLLTNIKKGAFGLLMIPVIFVLLPIILPHASATAETPEEKGLAIAREADIRDKGFNDFTINTAGKASVKSAAGHSRWKETAIKALPFLIIREM
jgi:hypothetical protein